MATTRTIRAEQPGPVTVRSKTRVLDLTVIAEPGRDYGEIVISTSDDEGSSADIVNGATLTASGRQIGVEVNEAAGGVTVIQSGGGTMIAGDSYGTVVVGSGITMVNGRIVGGNAAVVKGGGPITITAYVPAGSNVSGSSQSGDLETQGRLAQVSFSAQSGDADLVEVGTVNVSTQSGDITVNNLTGSGLLNSMSGDISVHGPSGATASARTMSGDVRGSGGIALDASTMSGRVRNR